LEIKSVKFGQVIKTFGHIFVHPQTSMVQRVHRTPPGPEDPTVEGL